MPTHDHAHDHDHPHEPVAPLPRSPSGDMAQQSLVDALRMSFHILRVLMIVLVCLYVFSGVFRVESDQQGLIARLGRLRENPEAAGRYVYGPGWYTALPDPFDTKYQLTGQVQLSRNTRFMFKHAEAETARDLSTIVGGSRELTPGVDGAMLTGDRNLSHGRWEVQYRIEDAAKFVTNIGKEPKDLEPLLQRLTETAVVREVASRTVEDVTRLQREAVRAGVQSRLQKSLDSLDTGVKVIQVLADTIEPGAVRDAFIDVTRAEAESSRSEAEAREEATKTLNRAAGQQYPKLLAAIREYGNAQLRGATEAELNQQLAAVDAELLEAEQLEAGQVAVKLREARSRANQIDQRLRQEYEQFTKYLEQRQARPVATVLDLWAQMREDILGSRANEIFFVSDAGEIEILTNRDPVRLQELQDQRLLMRQMGGRQP